MIARRLKNELIVGHGLSVKLIKTYREQHSGMQICKLSFMRNDYKPAEH